ncbi:hypothetical protein KNP414_03372 [Paenibacillus mucilaginosus KNP414]|uniref:Uncharacterized protein n=1 Tax=Paenibacillus mucilaginosus (strain KNP414) TaxID=1036673 RepID=F8F642_PAEMK|nr:hypothetical protein KNP414_03372 [Paenibacillus mucilaginosus KNP414]
MCNSSGPVGLYGIQYFHFFSGLRGYTFYFTDPETIAE